MYYLQWEYFLYFSNLFLSSTICIVYFLHLIMKRHDWAVFFCSNIWMKNKTTIRVAQVMHARYWYKRTNLSVLTSRKVWIVALSIRFFAIRKRITFIWQDHKEKYLMSFINVFFVRRLIRIHRTEQKRIVSS